MSNLLIVSWHYCVSILSIVLLFHASISNENLFKNGALECDETCKHYGMNRIKNINTRRSHYCEKDLSKRIQNNS